MKIYIKYTFGFCSLLLGIAGIYLASVYYNFAGTYPFWLSIIGHILTLVGSVLISWVVEKTESTIESLIKKIGFLQDETDKLNNKYRGLTNELQSLRKRYRAIEKQVSNTKISKEDEDKFFLKKNSDNTEI